MLLKILLYLWAYKTPILLFCAWLYSAAGSTMPELEGQPGFFVQWAHDLFQFTAANVGKISLLKKNS